MAVGFSETVTLRDESQALIRDVEPTYARLLARCFAGFSEPSLRAFQGRAGAPGLFQAQAIAHEARSPTNVRVLACVGEEPAGYGSLSQTGPEPDFPLLGIGVADAFQGLGLGRALMHHLIERARAASAQGVDLNVFKDNWRALRLYSSLGFRLRGETEDHKQHSMRLAFHLPPSPFRWRGVSLV